MYDQVVHGDEMVVGADATVKYRGQDESDQAQRSCRVEALRCSRAQ